MSLPQSPALNPSEIRKMFGDNLRELVKRYPSVASLCRELDINRTQFNRYLSGESFPRPDVLYRLCRFFDLDARILLEPLDKLSTPNEGLLSHPAICDYFNTPSTRVDPLDFPSGFYHFSRRSFTDENRFLQGLVFVFRKDDYTFVRGYEARSAMRAQGMPLISSQREFRAYALRQEDGVSMMIARRGGNTGSFNFLSRVTSFQNNIWEGYVTRTIRESATNRRAARMVYEHLGQDMSQVMTCARASGLCGVEDLKPFHRKLLQNAKPFD